MPNSEASSEEPNDEESRGKMRRKYRTVITVFSEDLILLECPFCGRTLIRTDYKKIQKLLHVEGTPRGKICSRCGGIALLRLKRDARETLLARLDDNRAKPGLEPPPEKGDVAP